jgi:pimeloyl-ACP methyl ester carboxylesterase
MAKVQVVILHGWSDNSDSFKPLARWLKLNGHDAVPLMLGDYISLRDDVKIDDVAKRMEEVVREKTARGELKRKFDLIVHSTGGLVARRWITMHYVDRACPVRNLLMLAPANFGSKLAHLGRSMLGRLAKGLKTGFETGEEMLYALELGSPFQWALAQEDLFLTEESTSATAFYRPDTIRPFVIVGTHPYKELFAKITNENGSDGTVRVAAANLNSYGMTVDFSGGNLMQPIVTPWRKRGGSSVQFPLAVLPDRTHGSVVNPLENGLSGKDSLGPLILQALRTRDARSYAEVLEDWNAVSLDTRTLAGDASAAQAQRDALFGKRAQTPREYFHEYYQIFVRVEDEFGVEIPDYFLSFMPKKKTFSLNANVPKESAFFHAEVLEDVHVHRASPANRALFLDRYDIMHPDGGFYSRIAQGRPRGLQFTITAADPGDRIAYFTHSKVGKRGLVNLHQETPKSKRWLKRHCTHFVRVVVPRAGKDEIFKLKRG